MSSSGHDRYYGLSKSLRSSPGESQNVFFQTGQGGRTVLPPLSSAFPTSRFPVPTYNQFTQPRSSPGRFELNPALYNNNWPTSASPPPTSSFPNYETDERYPHEAQYTYYPPSRSPPPISGNPPEPRKLPRLTTTTGAGWHTPPHMPASSNYTTGSYIRSPTATYHPEYDYQASSQGHGYTYQDVHPQDYDDHHHVPSMNTQGHMTTTYEGSHHHHPHHHHHHHHRPSSPPIKGSSQVPLPSISPTDESTVKKKRKRADAAQLKVLNETYNRTAFPSTEERLELAKALDMSPRSVQIWFQNKRQSMRQTNRQTSTTSSSTHPYTIAGQDNVIDDLVEHPSLGYGGSMSTAEIPYTSKHSPETSRSHPSQSASSHRRRNQEEIKWSRAGGY